MHPHDFQHRSYDDKKQTFGNYIISCIGLQLQEDGTLNRKWFDAHYTLEELKGVTQDEISALDDCTISCNMFMPYKPRSANNVLFYCNIFVDLDYYKCNMTLLQAIKAVNELIAERKMPLYSALVNTGHGLHLVFHIARIGRKSAKIWNCLQYYFTKICKHIGADFSGVTDPTKSIRLHGSNNTSKGATVDVLMEDYTGIEYTTDELLLYVDENAPNLPIEDQKMFRSSSYYQARAKGKKRQPDAFKRQEQPDDYWDDVNALKRHNENSIAIVTKVAEMRGTDGNKGHRNYMAHLLANSYAQLRYSPAQNGLMVGAFIALFFNGTEREMKEWLGNVKGAYKMRKRKNGTKKIGYAYSIAKIVAKLELTEEEMRKLQLKVQANAASKGLQRVDFKQQEIERKIKREKKAKKKKKEFRKVIRQIQRKPETTNIEMTVVVKGGHERADGYVNRLLSSDHVKAYRSRRKKVQKKIDDCRREAASQKCSIGDKGMCTGTSGLPFVAIDSASAVDIVQKNVVVLSSWLLE